MFSKINLSMFNHSHIELFVRNMYQTPAEHDFPVLKLLKILLSQWSKYVGCEALKSIFIIVGLSVFLDGFGEYLSSEFRVDTQAKVRLKTL